MGVSKQASSCPLPSRRFHFPKVLQPSQTVPPAEDQTFEQVNLWGMLPFRHHSWDVGMWCGVGICPALPGLGGAHVESKKSHWNLWWVLEKRDQDSTWSGGFVTAISVGICPYLRSLALKTTMTRTNLDRFEVKANHTRVLALLSGKGSIQW